MKKSFFYCAALVFIMMFSCASEPETGDRVEPSTESNEVAEPSAPEESFTEPLDTESAAVVRFAAPPEESPAYPVLPEPDISFLLVRSRPAVVPAPVQNPPVAQPTAIAQTPEAQPPAPVQNPPAAQPPAIAQTPEAQPPAAAQNPPTAQPPIIVQIPEAQPPAPVQNPPTAQLPQVTQTPDAQQSAQAPAAPSATTPSPVVPVPEERPAEQPANRVTQTQPRPLPALPDLGREEEPVFSRYVEATVGQIIEIPFSGTGWIYLGEANSRRGVSYDSRRLDPEGQSFIFRAEEAGSYALKFNKQDFIRNFILNDYVSVRVTEVPPASSWSPDRPRVVAQPRWPTNLEEAQLRRAGEASPDQPQTSGREATVANQRETGSQRETAQAGVNRQTGANQRVTPAQTENQPQAGPESAPQTALPGAPEALTQSPAVDTPAGIDIPANAPPQQYTETAQRAFTAGETEKAIAILNLFRERFPMGSDEAYWLLGQFYEADTPSRDILLALDFYRRLVREYPQSSRYASARSRIAYLERFYININ